MINSYSTLSLFNAILCWVCVLLSIIMPLLHTLLLANAQNKWPNMYDIMLKYALFFNIGCAFLCIGLSVFTNSIETQNSLLIQHEIGLAYIAIAILGMASLFNKKAFLLATTVVTTIWLWGTAFITLCNPIFSTQLTYASLGLLLWQILVPCMLLALNFMSAQKYKAIR